MKYFLVLESVERRAPRERIRTLNVTCVAKILNCCVALNIKKNFLSPMIVKALLGHYCPFHGVA